MKTIKAVADGNGISVRTLQYYDKINLLKPSEYTESGYRLYSKTDVQKLQQILLFRELQIPLAEIKQIMDSPEFDENKAIEEQVQLLIEKKERLENLIDFAQGLKLLGWKYMDFSEFDSKKIDEYAKQAKENWGQTDLYKEFEEKQKKQGPAAMKRAGFLLMDIFTLFGEQKDKDPKSDSVQALVKKLQEFINENFYTCSDTTLLSLGKMYSSGGEFTTNIDAVAGEGTANFVYNAIEYFVCGGI